MFYTTSFPLQRRRVAEKGVIVLAAGVEVTVVFLQEFYRAIGVHEVRVVLEEGATVRDLIEYIDSKIKPGFKDMVLDGNEIRYPVEIAVNGRRVEALGGLEARLKNGDRVVFSPRALFVV